jgi:hypothetical protein
MRPLSHQSQNNVSYVIKTKYAKFHVKFRITSNSDTNPPTEFTVSIESTDKKCVQLTVPTLETGETNAKLLWVESDEKCSLERYIKKGLAQHMVLLGLTIIRMINKNIRTVSFEDTSSFQCHVPNEMSYLKTTRKSRDENQIQVPMKPFHIAFHEATWYEYYFDAKLEKNHHKYCELKKNMYKSEMKPPTFNFINEDLQRELEPLYNETTNWYEFFQAIAKKYGIKKCAIVYPWISSAMEIIFEGNIYESPSKWYIDFDENVKKNKTPLLEISKSDFKKIDGGKRITRRNRSGRRFTYSRTHIFPHIRKIQEWNYTDFLSPSEDLKT